MTSAVSGFVLAGGASRRMGSDKALLGGADDTLLLRVARVVEAGTGSAIVVAPQGRYEDMGVPVLADRWPGEGPLGGIVTALEFSRDPLNLIVAVDMPAIDVPTLREMLVAAAESGRTVIPAHKDGATEPLCAVYHRDDLPALRAFFDSGGRRMREAIEKIPYHRVEAAERVFANINTPEEWEAARA
ncbi:MAG: molybdenum cofactor guanylyltransferase [Acidobacteria bacterium]|nr:molybdenum cofactor guanylyltransferase [Acidobacteriota bacterium]